MFISFGDFMKGAGMPRLGIRLDRRNGCFYAFIMGFVWLFYWMILFSGWLMYAVCWLFFYWPIKAIVNAAKKRK